MLDKPVEEIVCEGGKVVGVKSQGEVSRVENGTRIPDGSWLTAHVHCTVAFVGLCELCQHDLTFMEA